MKHNSAQKTAGPGTLSCFNSHSILTSSNTPGKSNNFYVQNKFEISLSSVMLRTKVFPAQNCIQNNMWIANK